MQITILILVIVFLLIDHERTVHRETKKRHKR